MTEDDKKILIQTMQMVQEVGNSAIDSMKLQIGLLERTNKLIDHAMKALS